MATESAPANAAPAPAPASDDPHAMPSEEDTDALPTLARQQTSFAKEHPPVEVMVGTSASASDAFVRSITRMVNTSYGYHRVSEGEVASRLAMGDAGSGANRVLHVATRDGVLVGCCSSTKQTPWCPYGCGHWGLLVVDVTAQGSGVASALVAAAEERLRSAGLTQVQMEYEYTPGDPQSERLYRWYEGKLGFSGGGAPSSYYSSFRRCRKRLDRPTAPSATSSSSPSCRSSPSAVHPAASRDDASAVASPGCFELMRKMLRVVGRRALFFPPLEHSS